MTSPVIVAGAPRSGTTWIAETLASDSDVFLVHEPDNHRLWPAAALAKAGLGRHPVLRPSDIGSPTTAAYEHLWQAAAQGADNQSLSSSSGLRAGWRVRRGLTKAQRSRWVDGLLAGTTSFGGGVVAAVGKVAPRPGSVAAPHTVIKTVQATFALDFVSSLIGAPVVLVRRDPRNAVASWLDLGWTIPRYELDPRVHEFVLEPAGITPPKPGSPATELAWAYLLLDHGMTTAARTHPGWVVVEHEDLCDDPAAGFEALCATVGIPWTDAIDRALTASDGDGDGYETTRRRSEQRDRWRSRLSEQQVEDIAAVAALFPAT